MYTEMKFTGFVLSNRINDDIDIIEGDNIIDTIYSELNFWMPLALTELVQSAYEGLPTQRVQQIRSESNSCIISKSKLESSFPWIESECSNTLENSDSKSTYGDGESGFKFVREEGRKNRCILFGYTQDNFKLSYYSKINSLDTTNVTDTINYLRSRNWIDDQTKAVMISRVIMSKEAGSFQVFLMSFEVVLDHVERSINQFVVTPMLDEPIVIIYSVLILIATGFMLFILIIDLLDYELFKKRMDSLRARLRSEIQSEDLLLEEEKEAFPASESVEDINVKAGNRDHVIEQMVERRIRWWKRLAFKFRSPNIFECSVLIFLIFYWVNFCNKMIFAYMFNRISIKDEEYLEVLYLEAFQYWIYFFDYVISWLLSGVLISYLSSWIPSVNIITWNLNRFCAQYLLPSFVLLIYCCCIAAFYMFALGGTALFFYNDVMQTFVGSLLMLTRGSSFHRYKHRYLDENDRYSLEQINIWYSLGLIILFHYIGRYFVMNIGVAAYFSVFNKVRKEAYDQKVKAKKEKELKKLMNQE